MIAEIDGKLVSHELFEKKFVCDLNACKGTCCVEGDAGAPLEKEELLILEEIQDIVKEFLPAKAVKALEEQGPFVLDDDGEFVTPLVNNKECAYAFFDNKGIAKCGIEEAHRLGKVGFKKPISCHLFPIRLTKLKEHIALNYSYWHICEPACDCGEKLDVKVYKFLREAIVRKFGQQFFDELESLDLHLQKGKDQ